MNIAEIEEAVSALAERPFEPATFASGLFAAYGANSVTLTKLRSASGNKSDVDGGTLWRLKAHVAVCAPGEVTTTLDRLAVSPATTRGKARFVAATDGSEFAMRDLQREDADFLRLTELGDRFGFLLPLAGYERYAAAEENPVDVKAANRLKRIHDAVVAANPDWAEDDMRHALHLFMTRLVFCLFAEDTGIFPDGLFARTITEQGGRDGAEMGRVLPLLFRAMSTPEAEREAMPVWAGRFPYVNGGLFTGSVAVPVFDRAAFRHLLDAARLNWRDINPDIFGSMIQVVTNEDDRHETGLHYTSVPNILKCLDPLFLDSLRAEARRPALKDESKERRRLRDLLVRLTKVRVFDPACGSGNFLVIAYRELRLIELAILERLTALGGTPPGVWSHVELSNFFGIELADFAAETAKLSLLIAKFQMDRRTEGVLGRAMPALPLGTGGHIVTDNALRADWLAVCPKPVKRVPRQAVLDLATIVDTHDRIEVPDTEVETYIVGNPPYLGRAKQTAEQKADKEHVFAGRLANWKSLDYVAGWLLKGADYLAAVQNASLALVATNSICQGQQVAILWRDILGRGLTIGFGHTSFKWKNNAGKNAGVTCVIVGVASNCLGEKVLFDGDTRRAVERISPYLTATETVYVTQRRRPLSDLPLMRFGNMPLDGGNLLLTPEEHSRLLAVADQAVTQTRRIFGSREFIRGLERYCLWLSGDWDETASRDVAVRVEKVREFRTNSKDAGTQGHADRPHQFRETHAAQTTTIIVPSVSSERREYLPVGYLTEGEIVSNLAFALYDAPLWTLALIASKLHLAWIGAVCGKLKTDFRYSNTLGWHTFPVPPLSDADKRELTARAEAILIARAELGGTIAELYDPDKMPDALREAHHLNDAAIERIYLGRPFRSDTERLEHLFRRYSRMIEAERGAGTPPEPAPADEFELDEAGETDAEEEAAA